MVVLGLVLGVYAFEAYVFLITDQRSALDVFFEERSKGSDPVFAFFPGKLKVLLGGKDLEIEGRQVLPLGGVSQRKTVYCLEVGKEPNPFALYQSDEHGFRNPKGIWQNAPIDVAVIGDSFTQGACVSEGKDFPSYIRNVFPKTINLGMRNNGTLLNYAVLREYGAHIKPKTVVWAVYGNDFFEHEEKAKPEVLARYLEAPEYSQRLFEMQDAIDAMQLRLQQRIIDGSIQNRYWAKDRFSLRRLGGPIDFLLLRHARTRFNMQLAARKAIAHEELSSPDDKVASFMDIIGRAKKEIEGWGGQLVVAWIPMLREFNPNGAIVREVKQRIVTQLDLLSVPVLDGAQVFVATGREPIDFYQCERCHYTEEGYRLIGEAIGRWLQDLGRMKE